MKISIQPPLHLSNLEVLNHFISLKKDTDLLKVQRANHDLRDKVDNRKAYPIAKEREESPDASELPILNEVVKKREDEADRRGWSDELAWIQDAVITYLCADHVPTSRQTDEGVARLADELQNHQLTKGEVLQIVNLAPTSAVELYAIIEDVDSRFLPDANALLDEIGEQVAATLLSAPQEHFEPFVPKYHQSATVAHGDFEGEEGEEEEEGVMQQEFVTEAEYGANYEGGVDDDAREEMD